MRLTLCSPAKAGTGRMVIVARLAESFVWSVAALRTALPAKKGTMWLSVSAATAPDAARDASPALLQDARNVFLTTTFKTDFASVLLKTVPAFPTVWTALMLLPKLLVIPASFPITYREGDAFWGVLYYVKAEQRDLCTINVWGAVPPMGPSAWPGGPSWCAYPWLGRVAINRST